MAFNFASYDYNKVHCSEQLLRDLMAVRSEIKAKEKKYAERRSELQRSVSQAPALLDNDGGLRMMQREAHKLRELYDAIKAKHFFTYSAVPYDKETEEERLVVAQRGYRKLKAELTYARDFATQVKEFDEDDGAKRRVAELETNQLVAFHFLKETEGKVQAVDAWQSRFNAAERVVAVYKNKQRLQANGGEDAIEAARGDFNEAVAMWNEAATRCRKLRYDIEQRIYPVHGASRAQKLVQTEAFGQKLYQQGPNAAISYAATLGINIKFHLDAQSKAPRSFDEMFPTEAKQVVGLAQPPNDVVSSVATELSSVAVSMQGSTSASSWEQLSADSSSAASRSRSGMDSTGGRSVASCSSGDSTIGSWFMPVRNNGSRCGNASKASSNAGSRYEATDSDDSSATLADLTFGADRTSTPLLEGSARQISQISRAEPEEFGDATSDSLASFMPRSAPAMQRMPYAVPRLAARSHYRYVGTSGAESSQGTTSFFASTRLAPVPASDAMRADAVLEIDWENCTAWFAPLRRGIGNGHFLTLVRNGHFGQPFPSALRCTVGNSDPNRIGANARRRIGLDEPYATVTFSNRADAELCIKLVNDASCDFGVTPLGDNDAPRKLDADWSNNPHLNGLNKARDDAAFRH